MGKPIAISFMFEAYIEMGVGVLSQRSDTYLSGFYLHFLCFSYVIYGCGFVGDTLHFYMFESFMDMGMSS